MGIINHDSTFYGCFYENDPRFLYAYVSFHPQKNPQHRMLHWSNLSWARKKRRKTSWMRNEWKKNRLKSGWTFYTKVYAAGCCAYGWCWGWSSQLTIKQKIKPNFMKLIKLIFFSKYTFSKSVLLNEQKFWLEKLEKELGWSLARGGKSEKAMATSLTGQKRMYWSMVRIGLCVFVVKILFARGWSPFRMGRQSFVFVFFSIFTLMKFTFSLTCVFFVVFFLFVPYFLYLFKSERRKEREKKSAQQWNGWHVMDLLWNVLNSLQWRIRSGDVSSLVYFRPGNIHPNFFAGFLSLCLRLSNGVVRCCATTFYLLFYIPFIYHFLFSFVRTAFVVQENLFLCGVPFCCCCCCCRYLTLLLKTLSVSECSARSSFFSCFRLLFSRFI